MARRRKRSKKWLKMLLFLMLLVVAGVICYLVYDAYFKDDGGEPVEPESSLENEVMGDTLAESKVEAEVVETPVENATEKPESKADQFGGVNPNENSNLTGNITMASVLDGILRVRVNIDQYLSSGSCELGLVRDGVTIYNMSTKIEGMVTTATCDGFDIPVEGLGDGMTQIVINLVGGEKAGIIEGEAEL